MYEFRAARGWSQAEMAERLGVSRQTVIGIESGKTEPALPLAFRIAWVFEKPLEEIFVAELEDKMAVLNATWQYEDRIATAFDEMGDDRVRARLSALPPAGGSEPVGSLGVPPDLGRDVGVHAQGEGGRRVDLLRKLGRVSLLQAPGPG
jgi:putative transcriptional regulator